jgi:hypothetical protein
MLGGTFLIFVIVLMLDWDLPLRRCIVRPVGGAYLGGFMTTHSGWDTMLSSDKAGWDSKASNLMKSVKRGMVVLLSGCG